MQLSHETIVAAKLADKDNRSTIDFSQGTDWDLVLTILVANKVPLISIKNDLTSASCPLLNCPRFIQEVADEVLTGDALRAEYTLLRESFLKEGIQSILFKSVGLAPSFPYTSDNLDTLIRPAHVAKARIILNNLGYVELKNIEEPNKFLFRKFRGGESVSAIHLHSVVGWGVPFLDDDALWSRYRQSVDDPLVNIPALEDGLLVTVAHAFYENKSFKLLDIVRIRHCLREAKFDYAEIERITKERGWFDGLAFILLIYSFLEEKLYGNNLIPSALRERLSKVVAAHSWMQRQLAKIVRQKRIGFPFRVSFFWGKIFYYKKILIDQKRFLKTRLHDVIQTLAFGIKLKLRIRGQKGLLVTFSGIDGSGKSEHAKALLKAFEISEIKAHVVWSRVGTVGWLGQLTTLFFSMYPTIKECSDISSTMTRRRQRLRHPLLRVGWILFSLADLLVRYNLHGRLTGLTGRVIVLDRYAYDALVEISASLPRKSAGYRCAQWALDHFCPRPDIAWLLDVPGRAAATRQSDEPYSDASVEELELQRASYLKLFRCCNLHVVDTNTDVTGSTSRVVRETLWHYYKDYRTAVNAILLSNSNQMNK